MTAYYNEIDKFAAEWLRNLIAAGHLAPGIVDERDIREVRASDLVGYAQCHFFAGIGGWGRALRLAGWPDERPVWTGSCPCQPFSAAGKGAGFADRRHLWPEWFRLIGECRPATLFGEQVASQDGLGWLDAVYRDLEGAGYAVGAADLCAAGVGAPHLRQRLWFVAYAGGAEPRGLSSLGREAILSVGSGCELGDSPCGGLGIAGRASGNLRRPAQPIAIGVLGDAACSGLERAAGQNGDGAGRVSVIAAEGSHLRGFWSDAEWIPCRDGKARPVEPGTFPLAHGVPARVGKLRAYGNAIVPEVGAVFIRAASEAHEAREAREVGG